MTSQSQKNILFYFQELLESNKLTYLKSTALDKIKNQYGSLVESMDLEKGIIKYEKVFYDQATDGPVEVIVTYSFAKEFPLEVKIEAQIAKGKIDATVVEINKAGNNANEFLMSQLRHLSSLVEKSKVIYPKLKFIEANLLEILTYLVDKYSLKDFYKKQTQITFNKNSFFEVNTKSSILIKVYDIAIDLEIFDDENTSQETFMNVLGGNPSKTKEILIFTCNNELTAHFINSISPLFNNLSTAQIDKSKSFVNKNGKVLNQADLDNANNRLRKKSSPQIERISNALSKVIRA